MKIYHNSRFVAALKQFIPHRKGAWLNRLIGIDLQENHQGDINVHPVYRSFQIRRFEEGVIVEVPIFNTQLLILIDEKRIHCKFINASQLQFSDVEMIQEEKNE